MLWLLYYDPFFLNDTATTEIYTLSLHDALPISASVMYFSICGQSSRKRRWSCSVQKPDRKSTRLNSSHGKNSYAVFCLEKENDLDKEDQGAERDQQQRDHAVEPAASECGQGSSGRTSFSRISCPCCDITDHFFFNETATAKIYTLSLHDALPI